MIVFDGRLNESGTVAFDLSDRGLTLGDGLFETMLAVDRRVFRRVAHLDRMMGGAAAFAIPVTRERLESDLDLLLATLPDGVEVIRLAVTRGPGGRGLRRPETARPTVIVTHAPWSADPVMRPVRLVTSTIRRNETSPAARWKTSAYVDAIAALAEAEAKGADDALLLNMRGDVACTTSGNIFAIEGDVLLTPQTDDGILDGTTRGLVLELARTMGLRTKEMSLKPIEFATAEALFLTNSVRLINPVVGLDRRRHDAGHPVIGRLCDAIGARIAAECGRDPRAVG
ncbi:MAG: aminotransferase class IV [Siculibacillus sp.]|nr:aminotransferase class IV [Siculibacillus sp.]